MIFRTANPLGLFLFGREGVSVEETSVERTLAAIGEKWTLLITRDAGNGVGRFDDFRRRHIGMSDAVLSPTATQSSATSKRPGGDLHMGKGRLRHRARGLTTYVCDWGPCTAVGSGRSDETHAAQHR